MIVTIKELNNGCFACKITYASGRLVWDEVGYASFEEAAKEAKEIMDGENADRGIGSDSDFLS